MTQTQRIAVFCLISCLSFSLVSAQEKKVEKPKAEKAGEAVVDKKQPAKKEESKPKSKPEAKEKATEENKAKPKSEEEKKVEEKKAEDKGAQVKKEEEPKTIKLEPELFEKHLELTGVLEATRATPISVQTEKWTDLVVKTVVEHGTEVKKGDVLIQFDTQNLERSIEDNEHALPNEILQLQASQAQFEIAKQTLPLTLDARRKSKLQREEDYTYYEKISRPMDEKSARQDLKSYQNSLAYNEEELRQLKKMYENDDMTEETEEIILQRAQDSVDRSRWYVERAEQRTDRSLNKFIPREHESRERSYKIGQIGFEESLRSVERDIEFKRMDLESKQRSIKRKKEYLEYLEADLERLTVRAPHDGIVYYGASKQGRWTTATTVEKKLIPGGRAGNTEVLLTVVDPSDLQLRAAVAEDKLKDLKLKQKAEASMKWDKDIKLPAKVEHISYVPLANTTFDTTFSLDIADAERPLYPGMNANIKINTYRNRKALVVPPSAVKKDGDKAYVFRKDGTKRNVTLGPATKDKQVITKGLKPGDEIRQVAAEDKKPTTPAKPKPAAK